MHRKAGDKVQDLVVASMVSELKATLEVREAVKYS